MHLAIDCNNLLEYLKLKSPEILNLLYNYPSTCLAIYRELPEIARQLVIRVLFVEQPVPQAVVTSWASQHFAREQLEAIQCLTDLCLWRTTAIPGGLSAWELCPIYKKNLKYALLGGGKPWPISHALEKDSKPRNIFFLDSYAMSRWRCVLHFMAGPGTAAARGDDNEGISPDAVRILLHANLMKRDEKDGITITQEGFQFLLCDTQSQVWHFMVHYLDTCEERGLHLAECLSMLLQLSFSSLGQDYRSEGMSSRMLTFLQHLRELGLVFQRKRKEGRFYPTRLAININGFDSSICNIPKNQGKCQESGFVIVETNFRIYAYTESVLQVSILALFTELICRFPNLVVGVLTRDSVRQAFRAGITSDQIVSYLEQYGHPNMVVEHSGRRKVSVPSTIVDQIKLWEQERNRFIFTEGVVYNQFLSLADFVTLRDYAQSINMLIWQNERTRTMVVDKGGHDDVKKFWKRYSRNGI